jgi:hypothetical protein
LVLLLTKLKIIWLSNLPILSVSGEGYSRNVLRALNLISKFLFHQIKSHNSATTEVKIIKKCTDPQTTIPNHLVKFEQYWSMQGKS